MTIALETLPVTEVVVEIPGGHRQVTPQRGGRYYLRAGSDERYRSISGLPWPADFAGATRYMAGTYVAEHIAELAASPLDEIRAKVAGGAEDELTKAAERGTAVHHYVECMVTGAVADWDYLERCGAGPYLAAVDAYLADHPPAPGLDEVTVFGESCGHKIAGTVDRVDLEGPVIVRDYKTRTTRHDRREKEAAQLGAYAWCLTNGCYVDERGRDRTLERIDWCEVVTFCPDGTYGIHRIETDVAIAAHEARMCFVDLGVGALYGKAVRGSAPSPAECFQARLDALGDDERMRLAKLWTVHQMPRIAELTEDHYLSAARLFAQVEPWPERAERVAPLATTEQVVDLLDRVRALPTDLATAVTDAAAGLRSLQSAFVSVDDLEDWERLVTPAEASAQRRRDEILSMLGEHLVGLPVTLGRAYEQWTELDLERAYVLAEAVEAGVLEVDGDGYRAPAAPHLGPKREVLAAAKVEAAPLGLPTPKKYDDVLADVVLFAATWAAIERTNTPNKEMSA